MRHWFLHFILPVGIVLVLLGSNASPATANPNRVSAVYVSAYSLAKQWNANFGVPFANLFNDASSSGALNTMLNQAARDIKNMGFTTVVLTPFYYPVANSGPLAASAPGTFAAPILWTVSIPYTCLIASSNCNAGTGFVELAARTFANYGLNTYIGLAPQRQLTDSEDSESWLATCEDLAWNDSRSTIMRCCRGSRACSALSNPTAGCRLTAAAPRRS